MNIADPLAAKEAEISLRSLTETSVLIYLLFWLYAAGLYLVTSQTDTWTCWHAVFMLSHMLVTKPQNSPSPLVGSQLLLCTTLTHERRLTVADHHTHTITNQLTRQQRLLFLEAVNLYIRWKFSTVGHNYFGDLRFSLRKQVLWKANERCGQMQRFPPPEKIFCKYNLEAVCEKCFIIKRINTLDINLNWILTHLFFY